KRKWRKTSLYRFAKINFSTAELFKLKVRTNLIIIYFIYSLKTVECQIEKNVHFRHILLFKFNRRIKQQRSICAVYGVNVINEETAQKWYNRFQDNEFDLNYFHRT